MRRRSRVIDLQTAPDLSLNDSVSHRYLISPVKLTKLEFLYPLHGGACVLKRTSYLFTALQALLQLFPSYQMHRSQSIIPPASSSPPKT